jgi:3-keto-disaccharide hydrolase
MDQTDPCKAAPPFPANSNDVQSRGASGQIQKRIFTSLLVLITVVTSGFVLAAQEKVKLPGSDWISLFNGTDLTGWIKIGNESWTVEDGLLHGRGVTKAYGYLETEKNYKDFQLSLRFKCVGDGNSGVFFHTGFKPGSVDTTQGMQFEIDCKMMHHTAGIYGEDGRGWVVWPAPENEGVVRMNEWNDYLVEVVGNRYRSRLNGVQMVDFTDPKQSSFDGKIALQLHAGGQGNMQFKDIWIRDLSGR